MKRETLLTIAVVALLVLNLGTLAFLALHHPPRPERGMLGEQHGRAGEPGGPQPPPPFDRMIVESLHLTSAQESQFDTLKRQHHESIVALDRQYEEMLRNYLTLLKPATNSSLKDSLERSMAAVQVKKASITLDHFRQLRAIGDVKQQAAFDSLIPRLSGVLTRPRPMPPPPPPPGEER